MMKIFQIVKHKEVKGRNRDTQGSWESKRKAAIDSGEKGERKNKLADEALMNIACNDIAINISINNGITI